MQYRKWGKNGDKLVCYSQQTNKKYLVKDADCDQEKIWAEEIEEIVIADIKKFALKYQEMGDEQIQTSVVETLRQKEATLKKKIKNLFNLYSETEDELLLETIRENKTALSKIAQQIEKEESEKAASNNKKQLKETLQNLSQIWDCLSFTEKQNIIRNIVDKIVVTDRHVTVSYNL